MREHFTSTPRSAESRNDCVLRSSLRPDSHGKSNPAAGSWTAACALIGLRLRRSARGYRSIDRLRVRQPLNRLEAFQLKLCEALVEATRAWYREHGQHERIVQMNLGKPLMTR